MGDKILEYKNKVRIYESLGIVTIIVTILLGGYFIIHPIPERKNNVILEFCEFLENVTETNIEIDKKIIDNQKEFCNKAKMLHPVMESLKGTSPIDSFTRNENLLYLITIVGLLFSILLFAKADISKKDFFKLTEEQYWHYNWINDLYKKVFTNKQEYKIWMKGFEDRYSEELHQAMELVFELD